MATELPGHFGLVILTLVFSSLVHHGYMSSGVVKGRKKYGVKYPALYASESTEGGLAFNCIQRGHQNSLEFLATHYVLTLLAGLKFPVFSTFMALIYLAGRIVYFQGYSTGEPKNRLKGGFMYIGLVGQLLAAIAAGISFLQS